MDACVDSVDTPVCDDVNVFVYDSENVWMHVCDSVDTLVCDDGNVFVYDSENVWMHVCDSVDTIACDDGNVFVYISEDVFASKYVHNSVGVLVCDSAEWACV